MRAGLDDDVAPPPGRIGEGVRGAHTDDHRAQLAGSGRGEVVVGKESGVESPLRLEEFVLVAKMGALALDLLDHTGDLPHVLLKVRLDLLLPATADHSPHFSPLLSKSHHP